MAKKSTEADILLGLKYDAQIHKLDDHDLAALIRAIYDMRLRGSTDEQMSPQAEMLFSIVYDEVAENAEAYREKCRKNAENARKGHGNSKESQDGDPCDRKRSQTTANDRNRPQPIANDRDRPHATAGNRREENRTELNGMEENSSLPPTSSNELVSPQGESAPDPEPAAQEKQPEPEKPEAPDTPKPSRRKNTAGLTKAQEARFNRWYAAYPKKVAPGEAQKAWKRIDPDDQQTEVMIRAVQTQLETDRRFTEGFIPNPATWLNRREWENSYDTQVTPAQNRRTPNDNRTNWAARIERKRRELEQQSGDTGG